ncbi:hypothetical protein Tco_0385056 [Tanacetum coccineum]
MADDVTDFAIALRMFTRSLVIQKRVKDLQMGVESYQKKINVTKPKITRFGIGKRVPYTPYQDPQGLIYVDDKGRNRLMWLDELYKFIPAKEKMEFIGKEKSSYNDQGCLQATYVKKDDEELRKVC